MQHGTYAEIRGWKPALALGVLLVLLRFVGIGTSPFVIDEPIFHDWAIGIARGEWFPLTGMSGSSLPVPYGAGSMWVYALPHLVSSHPTFIAAFHAFLFSLGFLGLFLAMRRLYGISVAAWTLLFAASSPFLFFFSRHPWDTTLFVPITGACLYLFSGLIVDKRRYLEPDFAGAAARVAGLGALAALAINIQLASGPFVIALSLAVLLQAARTDFTPRKRFFLVCIYGLTVAALIAPYLYAAYGLIQSGEFQRPAEVKSERWGDFRHLWWDLLFSVIGMSVWKATHFLEPVHKEFFQFAGALPAFFFRIDIFGWVPKFFAWAFLTFPLAALVARGWRGVDTFQVFAGFAFLAALLVFQYLNVPIRPHYFQSCWWLPFVGFGFALANAQGFWRLGLTIFGGATIAVNAIFLALALAFLIANGGTRGMHHGTGAAQVQKAAIAVCTAMREDGLTETVVDATAVFTMSNPLEYFARHSRDCDGLKFRVAKQPDPAARYRFVYEDSSATDARLHLVR